jgi:hypothetical protein
MSDQAKTVRFFWSSPRDILAMTHADQFPNEKFPPGIPSFVGTPIDNQLAMMATVRDENGRIVGVLSELEVFGRDGETDFDVYLSLVVPGRGALFVGQVKSFIMPDVEEPYRIAAEQGEWNGRVEISHTSGPLPGRYGRILTGTGEFEGATGRHQQSAVYLRIKGNETFVEVTETFLFDLKA